MKRVLTAAIFLMVSFSSMSADPQMEGAWFYEKSTNKMTDATEMFATTTSRDVYTRSGLDRNTTLVVRCSENKTEAYLSTDDYLGSREPFVTIRFDDEKPRRQQWVSAEGGNAAFAPNAISLIRKIGSHKKLIAGFEPYGSTMQVVEFDLSGSGKIAGMIADSCGWKI